MVIIPYRNFPLGALKFVITGKWKGKSTPLGEVFKNENQNEWVTINL